MGQRRIAFTSEESLLLTIDRGSVIAYEHLDGAIKWTFSVERANVVSVVYASTSALPSDVAAGPWRSPSSASTAVALDSSGVLHALDAVLGRELGTVPHDGEPVTLASGGDALAVAFEDRTILYRAGARHEIAKKATALAFATDGATLAIGTSKGELFFVDLNTRAMTAFESAAFGNISDVSARPGGGWLVSSERGLTAVHSGKNEKQLNGLVMGAVVDREAKRLAVHRSEANVVVYDWPPTVPVGRISAQGGTIRDIAFGPEDKIGVAMAGGGAAMVTPSTFTTVRTAQRPEEPRAVWLVSAESEAERNARNVEQTRRAETHEPKSNVGARLGIGGMVSLGLIVVRIFLIGARASTPTWTPPPNLGDYKQFSTCDHACEVDRLEDLNRNCRASLTANCGRDAREALDAFQKYDCTTTRTKLAAIEKANNHADGGSDALVNANQLLATLGLATACRGLAYDPPKQELSIVHRSADGTEHVDIWLTLDGRDQNAMWSSPEGRIFVASRRAGDHLCEVRQSSDPDANWTVDIHGETCDTVGFFGRSSTELYVTFGSSVRRFNGKTWEKALPIAVAGATGIDKLHPIGRLAGTRTAGADVFALSRYTSGQLMQVNGKTMAEAKVASTDPNIDQIFGGQSLWATGNAKDVENVLFKWNGKSWTRRSVPGDAGAETAAVADLWQSPGGHLFIATSGSVARSTNDGLTWTESDVYADKLWGRSNTDVYAAGVGGLQHFDGKAWTPVGEYNAPIELLTGDDKSLHLVTQKQ